MEKINLKKKQEEGTSVLNMLVYGASGAGKTTFASSAADFGKVLIVDAEAGAQYIGEDRAKNIDLIAMKDISILDEILIPENIKEYQTIVLDSVTEIMKKMVDHIKGSKETATLQDWGKIIVGMETYFRKFRDLNKHVILVAMETEKEDDNLILKRPSLSGKNLPSDMIGFQDVCMYIENTVQGRVGHVQPTQKFYAKDRTNKLPAKIEQKDLTVGYVVDKIITPTKPISDRQTEEIKKGMVDLDLDVDQMKSMFAYGGGTDFKDINEIGADKIIKAIELKLEKQNG